MDYISTIMENRRDGGDGRMVPDPQYTYGNALQLLRVLDGGPTKVAAIPYQKTLQDGSTVDDLHYVYDTSTRKGIAAIESALNREALQGLNITADDALGLMAQRMGLNPADPASKERVLATMATTGTMLQHANRQNVGGVATFLENVFEAMADPASAGEGVVPSIVSGVNQWGRGRITGQGALDFFANGGGGGGGGDGVKIEVTPPGSNWMTQKPDNIYARVGVPALDKVDNWVHLAGGTGAGVGLAALLASLGQPQQSNEAYNELAASTNAYGA